MWLKSGLFTQWNATKKVRIHAMYTKMNRNQKKAHRESHSPNSLLIIQTSHAFSFKRWMVETRVWKWMPCISETDRYWLWWRSLCKHSQHPADSIIKIHAGCMSVCPDGVMRMSVGVWGGISWRYKTDLVVVRKAT